jgi:hypothetical protein
MVLVDTQDVAERSYSPNDDPARLEFAHRDADVGFCDSGHFGELAEADVVDLLVEAIGLAEDGHYDGPLACR